MSLNADYQKLESGNDVRLIEVDGSSFGLTEVLRFHNYNIPHTEAEIVAAGGDEAKLPAKPIWWQGNFRLAVSAGRVGEIDQWQQCDAITDGREHRKLYFCPVSCV